MNPLLLALLIPYTASAFYNCTDPFCPSIWPKLKLSPDEIDEAATVYLKTDEESGCMCRVAPKQWTICFGREICTTFPRNLNVTTKAMRVKATKIAELRPGDLANVRHLETLEVDGNFNLSKIRSGTFVNMTKLRNLSISSNTNLRELEEGSFEGLVNLKELSLVKNAFSSVKDLSLALTAAAVPRLVKLELSQNNFVEVKEDDFAPMVNSSLEELNLVLCQIEYIHPEAFAPLTHLAALKLGENSFNTTTIAMVVEKTVEARIPLRLLNLCSVGFRKNLPKELLEAVAKSNITWLNLARNQFEVITSESFPPMPNLKILDLREVLALNITNDAFVGLPNLRVLLLSKNKLSSVPAGALIEHLTYLDLQDNSGNPFFPLYFSLFGQKFTNMKNLQVLNLGFNRINAIYNTTFSGLANLTVLGLKNATIYHIANNSFAMLTKLAFLNLENNHFAKNAPMWLVSDIFHGLKNLEVLFLGGCGISIIANHFKDLRNLKYLGLDRNKLITIHPQDFKYFPKLRSLDLSQNILQPWQQRIFAKNHHLKVLIANNNKFTYLSSFMLEDFSNFTRLELKDNPFTCDCTTFSIYRNREQIKILTLLEDQMVFCAFPETTTNQTLSKFFRMNESDPGSCQMSFSPKLVVVLPSVIVIVTVLISSFLIYYYRWHWRYWIFLTRLYLSRKGKLGHRGDKYAYTNYIYDAFVSYSNEDRNFVIRLVTMLENYPPYLKLCVYERDFQIGTMISENVLESVAKSRKTLLIISDSYAKSQWCRWESQIAEHHRLFFQNQNGEYVDDSLLLIKLGPVSESHLTPTLKYLLKTRIYLQWDAEEKKQKVFWEKLRGTLTPPEEINENTHL